MVPPLIVCCLTGFWGAVTDSHGKGHKFEPCTAHQFINGSGRFLCLRATRVVKSKEKPPWHLGRFFRFRGAGGPAQLYASAGKAWQ